MPWTAGLSVRVMTHERAHAGRRRVVEALMELAQEQRLAGVTVTRALAETPTHGAGAGGQRDGGHDGAPVIVELVDRAERVEAALPQIAALTPLGALTVTQIRIYLPASRLRASDVMEPPEHTARPDDPAADALHALLARGTRLIPVLDDERKPVGVVTLSHLLSQLEGDLQAHLLTLGQPERMREHLLLHVDGMRVRDLMRAPALCVRDDATLDAVARTLTGRRITRALVVDAHGRCVGVISEHALAEVMIRGLLLSDADALHLAPAHAEARAALAASVAPTGGEPLTAGTLADRTIPRLPETATWAETTQATTADGGVALVVDAQGRLRGVVEEGTLLERASGMTHEGGLSTLRRLLAQATGQGDVMSSSLAGGQARDLRAGALSQPARLVEAPETPLALALAHMVTAGGADYAVVAASDAPPEGILWRQDALRALVGG